MFSNLQSIDPMPQLYSIASQEKFRKLHYTNESWIEPGVSEHQRNPTPLRHGLSQMILFFYYK